MIVASDLEIIGSAQPDAVADQILAQHVEAMMQWRADLMKDEPQGTGPEAWQAKRAYYEAYPVPCPEYPKELRFDPEKLNSVERQQLNRCF